YRHVAASEIVTFGASGITRGFVTSATAAGRVASIALALLRCRNAGAWLGRSPVVQRSGTARGFGRLTRAGEDQQQPSASTRDANAHRNLIPRTRSPAWGQTRTRGSSAQSPAPGRARRPGRQQ